MQHKPGRQIMQVKETGPSSSHGVVVVQYQDLIAGLVIATGGGSAFVVWTLPMLIRLPSSGAIIQDYMVALLPTILVVLLLLLGWMIWRMMRNFLWRSSVHKSTQPGQTQGWLRKVGASGPHLRSSSQHLSTTERQKRRTRRLYAGRHYKGKVRQSDLHSLEASLPFPAVPFVAPDDERSSAFDLEEDHVSPEHSSAFDLEEEHIVRVGTNGSKPATSYATVGLPRSGNGVLSSASMGEQSSSLSPVAASAPDRKTPIALYLLKELVVEVRNAEGMRRTIPLQRKRREDGRYIERELLAYLAAQRGRPVHREQLLKDVFGYGLSAEKQHSTSLTNQLNRWTQLLRQDINMVAAELALPPLTIISSHQNEWCLVPEECQVQDLEEIERLHDLTEGVAGEVRLLPEIQDAYQALITAYKGDFLEHAIEDIVRTGGDDWGKSWVREPYTAYRTKYFQALWYRAEFWRIKGDISQGKSETERMVQRDYYERAAKLYCDYALHVLTRFSSQNAMRFDLEIQQRISLGERTLRACLDMYTATQNTQAGDVAYLTFARRMTDLTQGKWKPHPETVEAWKNVKAQTRAHRFVPKILPHDSSGETIL